MKAADLAEEIIRKRTQDLEARVRVSARTVSILSDITDCDRQMVYSILDWDKRPAHDSSLQARFDAGNAIEQIVLTELQRLGFRVILSQKPVEIKNRKGETIARGRVDGFIELADRSSIPFEIKSMNVNIFNSIKSIDDFRGKPWLRKYIRQLLMYLYGNNAEEGIFLLTDGLGHWKLFVLQLDYAEAERILQRLERVHEAVKAKSYPDRILYDRGVCGHCPFAMECLPDVINTEAVMVDNPEIAAKLDRLAEIKPMADEYEDVYSDLKDSFRGVEKSIVGGRWIVQNVPSQRTVYEIPEEVKEQIDEIKRAFQVKKPVVTMVIERLDK